MRASPTLGKVLSMTVHLELPVLSSAQGMAAQPTMFELRVWLRTVLVRSNARTATELNV